MRCQTTMDYANFYRQLKLISSEFEMSVSNHLLSWLCLTEAKVFVHHWLFYLL